MNSIGYTKYIIYWINHEGILIYFGRGGKEICHFEGVRRGRYYSRSKSPLDLIASMKPYSYQHQWYLSKCFFSVVACGFLVPSTSARGVILYHAMLLEVLRVFSSVGHFVGLSWHESLSVGSSPWQWRVGEGPPFFSKHVHNTYKPCGQD